MMVAHVLKQAGFEVIESGDGAQGLEQFDKGTIDLVITDLNMPVMDGLDFIRLVRARADAKTTPVLLLSTDSGGGQKDAAREAGASGWVMKPFEPAQLLSVVSKLLPTS